jgi:hypothetical protein
MLNFVYEDDIKMKDKYFAAILGLTGISIQ